MAISHAERFGQKLPAMPPECIADPDHYFRSWLPELLDQHLDVQRHFGSTDAVVEVTFTGDAGGTWHFTLGGGRIRIATGAHHKPSFTVTMPLSTWQRMCVGEVDGMKEFLRGRIKFRGSKLAMFRIVRLFS